jgi:hypothetical protein
MRDTHSTTHHGIELALDSRTGGLRVEDLPALPGIYAEIYRPLMGVRIGETGVSIRGKIRHDIRWFDSMRDGTAPQPPMRARAMRLGAGLRTAADAPARPALRRGG